MAGGLLSEPSEKNNNRALSIRTLIGIMASLLLVLGLLQAIAGYRAFRILQTQTLPVLQNARQILEWGSDIRSEFLLARQNEAQLIIDSQTRGFGIESSAMVASNQNHISRAQNLIDQIERLASVSDDASLRSLDDEIKSLRPLLAQYETTFSEFVPALRESKQPGGLEDRLQGDIVNLSASLAKSPNPEYLQLMDQIQTLAGTFVATGNLPEDGSVQKSLNRVIELVQSSQPSEIEPTGLQNSEIIDLANNINLYFGQLIPIYRKQKANIATFQDLTNQINFQLDRISVKSTSGVEHARLSMESNNRQAVLFLLLIGVLSLGFGIFISLLISRRIIPPLGSLSLAAERLGQGFLDQEVRVSGGAELVTLGSVFNSMASQLRQTLSTLEQRISERTGELEKRSQQIQFAAEVAREISITRGELDTLLTRSVDLIRDRFGYDHIGIFLIDERQEYAVLQAATGEAGRTMLANQHKLKIGVEGIVGVVTSSGKARISLDVDKDTAHYKNPLLPGTRSEMALPLRSGPVLIGALDVQSAQPSAFHQEDINILQLMADQLAIAIENTRLLQAVQDNLQQIQSAYGQYSQESWERLGKAYHVHGYQYTNTGIQPIGNDVPLQSTTSSHSSPAIHLPLTVRGEVIGKLEIWPEDQAQLTNHDREVLALIAERVSLAMDSARLYEEAKIQAAREQTLSDLTAKFTHSIRFDTLLRTAVQELAHLPKVTEASIHIELPEAPGRAQGADHP